MKFLKLIVVFTLCICVLLTSSCLAADSSSIFENESILQDELYVICYSKLNRMCDIYESNSDIFDPDYIDYAYHYYKLFLSVQGVSDSLKRMTEKEKCGDVIFDFTPGYNDVLDIQTACIMNSVIDSKWNEYATGSVTPADFAKVLMTMIRMDLLDAQLKMVDNQQDPDPVFL